MIKKYMWKRLAIACLVLPIVVFLTMQLLIVSTCIFLSCLPPFA